MLAVFEGLMKADQDEQLELSRGHAEEELRFQCGWCSGNRMSKFETKRYACIPCNGPG